VKLSARQKKILAAIVENYIHTGEPVGSKFLSSRMDIRVSPATLRSDMATLFELGYLEQPHTSAGRVPSHLGYREYIDSIIICQPLTKEETDEIDSLFNVKNPDPDKLLEDAADALSDYTGCAGVTSSISAKDVRVKRIDLIAAGVNTVVILLIASNGVIKNKVCRVDFAVTPELTEFFTKFANSRLSGRSLEAISATYISSVSVTLGEYSRIFTPLLVGIFELCKEVSDGQYYIGGGTKLLDYDEIGRVARDLLLMLENQERLHRIFGADDADFRILIGKENATMELVGSSLVATHYEIAGERAGTVGLIGPIRLDYAKIIPHLEYFADTLGKLLTETLETE
jgi:heat-inducible transcriptional repressor